MIRYRLAALCATFVLVAAGWEAAHLSGGAWRTVLTAAAFCAIVVAIVASLVLVLLPDRGWRALLGHARRFQEVLRRTALFEDQPAFIAFLVLGIATYTVLVSIHVARQVPPEGNDQAAYVVLAREIERSGGVFGCLRDLYLGRFEEANRHPLYPMLLSFYPSYEAGKWLSAALGGATLLSLTLLVRRRFGTLAGGIFCLLLATNGAFLHVSSLVACETLVILLAGVLYFLCERGSAPGSARASAAGAAYGLLYLAKAHAVVLLVGSVAWTLARRRWDLFTARYLRTEAIPFLVAAVVVASPLLTRNVVRYSHPLFNVNGHLFFMDRFVDPVALSNEKSVRQAALEYWQTHSAGDIVSREVKGLAWETYIMVRSLGPAPWDDARVLGGLLLLIACLVTAIVEPGSWGHLSAWAILLWLMFAWYVPIAAGERFILPLLAPVLTLAAAGIVRIAFHRRWVTAENAGFRMLLAGTAWCQATMVMTYLWLEF